MTIEKQYLSSVYEEGTLLRKLLLLPLAYSVAFFYIPFTVILIKAASLRALMSLGDELIVASFVFSASQALLSAFLSVALAVPVAYTLSHYKIRRRGLIEALYATAFVLPPISVATAFSFLLGKGGLLDKTLGIFITGFSAIIASHVFYNAPFSALVIASVWELEEPEVVDAARIYSKNPLLRFFRVELPKILPVALAAFAIVYMYCFTSLELVLILGSGRYMTVEAEIYTQYLVLFDEEVASVLAAVQTGLLLLVFYAYAEASRRISLRPTLSCPLKPNEPPPWPLVLYLLAFTISVAIPVAFVASLVFFNPLKMSVSLDGLRYILSGNYSPFLGTAPRAALVNTLVYAALAGCVSVILSLMTAISLREGRAEVAYTALSFAPSATSKLTLALGFIIVYSRLSLPVWFQVAIVHSLIAYPLAFRIIAHGLRSVGEDVEEAAILHGGESFALKKVILPSLRGSIITAGMLSMAVSVGEFGASSLLTGGKYLTLTVLAYRMLSARRFEAAGAASGLLAIIAIVLFLIARATGERMLTA